MALTINGTVWDNGRPLTVGGVQVQEVTANGVNVWRNNYAPEAPTSFTASNDLDGQIYFDWVLPSDQGVPICTYEVVTGSTVVASLEAGVSTATVTVLTQGTDYFVRAKNLVGQADSNTANGNSQEVGGTQIFTENGSFVKKRGWTNYNIQLIGGGKGGAGGSFYRNSYGGGAGEFKHSDYEILETTSITIGAGGAGGYSTALGANGGNTIVKNTVTALGGTSEGSTIHGDSSIWGTGGLSGVAGNENGKSATGFGAGGGSGGDGSITGASGGSGSGGKVVIEWG